MRNASLDLDLFIRSRNELRLSFWPSLSFCSCLTWQFAINYASHDGDIMQDRGILRQISSILVIQDFLLESIVIRVISINFRLIPDDVPEPFLLTYEQVLDVFRDIQDIFYTFSLIRE